MVAITPRTAWGARPVPAGRHVPLSARTWFTCHWPVMTDRPNLTWAKAIENIHVGQGWSIIGYNFLVGMNGEVIEGCGRDVRGIHAGDPQNTIGFGVCLLQPSTNQGVPLAPLSRPAQSSTRALYEQLCAQTGRRLNMGFHGQFMPTACAGPDVNAWVRSGMPAGLITIPPPPVPPPAPSTIVLKGATYPMSVFADEGQARQYLIITWWVDYLGRPPSFADLGHWSNVAAIRGTGAAFMAFLDLPEVRQNIARRVQ